MNYEPFPRPVAARDPSRVHAGSQQLRSARRALGDGHDWLIASPIRGACKTFQVTLWSPGRSYGRSGEADDVSLACMLAAIELKDGAK